MKITAATVVLTAALIVCPATAYADCGDPGQDPCTGPVPTADQVVGIMQQLTNPDNPAANKGNIVTPGLDPDEAGTLDSQINRYNARGYLPFTFVVTDIQPAPANTAGATVTAQANGHPTSSPPRPVVFVKEGERWLITRDTALPFLDTVWSHYRYRYVPVIP